MKRAIDGYRQYKQETYKNEEDEINMQNEDEKNEELEKFDKTLN